VEAQLNNQSHGGLHMLMSNLNCGMIERGDSVVDT
jgi:hypothetical protein